MNIYLIGSLRNPQIPNIAKVLRLEGLEVFDDWYAAGPEADDYWRDYEKARGNSYLEGLQGLAATHVFEFDKRHLDRSEAGILVLPAGKSGHLELGYLIGSGKPGYILLDDPERWDVMYKFATLVTTSLEEIIDDIKMGPKVSGSGVAGGGVVERSLDENWSSDSGTGPVRAERWFQRLPRVHERLPDFILR